MAEAYSRWAEFQPQQAAQAAAGISDPAEKNLALHGIIGGWAQADSAAKATAPIAAEVRRCIIKGLLGPPPRAGQ